MQLAIPEEFDEVNARALARLQERHRRIVEENIDAIVGKRVLDLACNNGRWSYAALAAGAESVTGVEGRKEKVDEALAIFKGLDVEGKYKFHAGDMFDHLSGTDEKFDTIFCLGVFYHIMDHHRLLSLMANTAASTIIIDSGFVRSFRNSVHVQLENPNAHRNALPKFEGQKKEFAGFISLGLMIQMAWNLGFSCRPVKWCPDDVKDKQLVHDYLLGRRFTLRLERTGLQIDPDWKDEWLSALTTLNPRFRNMFSKEKHDSSVDARAKNPLENMQFSIL